MKKTIEKQIIKNYSDFKSFLNLHFPKSNINNVNYIIDYFTNETETETETNIDFNIKFKPILIYYSLFLIINGKNENLSDFSSFIKKHHLKIFLNTFKNESSTIITDHNDKVSNIHYFILKEKIQDLFFDFICDLNDNQKLELEDLPLITDFIKNEKDALIYLKTYQKYKTKKQFDVLNFLIEINPNYWDLILNNLKNSDLEKLFNDFFSLQGKGFLNHISTQEKYNIDNIKTIIDFFKDKLSNMFEEFIYSKLNIPTILKKEFELNFGKNKLTYFCFISRFFTYSKVNDIDIDKTLFILKELSFIFNDDTNKKKNNNKYIIFLLNLISGQLKKQEEVEFISQYICKEEPLLLKCLNSMKLKNIVIVDPKTRSINIPCINNQYDFSTFKNTLLLAIENSRINGENFLFKKLIFIVPETFFNFEEKEVIDLLNSLQETRFFDNEQIQIQIDKLKSSLLNSILN